ncbi:WXG100 family type VII secretion target [Tessaracoccus sp.]
MGNKSVDRAAMAKAAQQIEAKHQQIHQLQSRLQGQMTDLSSRWVGNASTAFQRGYSQFDTEFEKVKQGLDKIHTALVETQREYVQREEENASTANQIAGLIG